MCKIAPNNLEKRSLMLGVDLQSHETLLKYIGGLHSYLRHTILIFNPNNLNDVCVQVTHLEGRGENTLEESSKNPFKGKGKEKDFKGKAKKNASIKKEGEKITCKHCSREGHDESHYQKLHPEMKPKRNNKKENRRQMQPLNMIWDPIQEMKLKSHPWG